jgi:molybdopterin biosynthesis enzyme
VGAASPGEGVRRAGEDLAAGVVLRGVGRRLRALDAAAGLAAGLPRALVRRPVLAVAAPEGDPAALLVAAIGHARGAAVLRAPPGELGDGDVVMALGDPAPVATRLAREGSLVAAGLALRPGETGACGLMGGRPVIAAPARIEAAFALFVALVGPCLDRLSGAPPEEPSFEGPLTRKVSSTVGLTEIALVRVTKGGLEPLGVADLTLQALLRAQGWFAVPPEEEGAPAGEPARAYPMPGRPDPQDP